MTNQRACERQCVNTVCQGSASDLVKTAMVNVQRRLDQFNSQARIRGKSHPSQPPYQQSYSCEELHPLSCPSCWSS
jgi:hypothetical protein